MSRRDFELIARVVRDTPRFRGEPFGAAVAEYRDDLARAFAAALGLSTRDSTVRASCVPAAWRTGQ